MSKNVLAYKPKESKKNPQGVARVSVGKNKARITFSDENDAVFDDGEKTRDFALADLPKYPKLTDGTKGEYFVKLSKDAEEVLSIGPVMGVFSGYIVDMSRPNGEDSDVGFYRITPSNEQYQPYDAINFYLEPADGPFKGVRQSLFMHYKFRDNDGVAGWDGNPENKQAKWLPRLVKVCEAADLVSEPIEWPSDNNICPTLLDRAINAHKKLTWMVKDGYVDPDSVRGSGASFADDEEDVDDAFPVKKAAKKTVTKAAPAKKASAKSSDRRNRY